MESLFLAVFNGRDINIGSSYLSFDRELYRVTGSTIGLTNSKTIFGRSLTMAMRYVNAQSGGCIG